MNTGVCTKRQVSTNVVACNRVVFQTGNSIMQTCHGDSGGPAFPGAVVVGATPFRQDMPPLVCFLGGFHCRVDADLAFINASNF